MRTIDSALLNETVRRIVATFDPIAVYLYGSHAYGQPHQDSDIDLLVVVSESTLPPHQRAVAAYRALQGLFAPVEIKVTTRAEFEQRARWQSSIEKIVQEKGKVLYGASI